MTDLHIYGSSLGACGPRDHGRRGGAFSQDLSPPRNPTVAFDDGFLRALAAPDLAAVLVMHTEIAEIDEALAVVVGNWDGPIGVYPRAGSYLPPTGNSPT